MLEPYPFDPIYGGFYDRSVPKDGKAVLKRLIERYVAATGRMGCVECPAALRSTASVADDFRSSIPLRQAPARQRPQS